MADNYTEKIHRINVSRELDKKQEIVNQLFAENGLTDEILELQVDINTQRCKEDIPDTRELVYKNFVQ